MKKMDAVKITFDNGQTMVTDYNSQVSREEIEIIKKELEIF